MQISTLSPSALWSSLTTPNRQANPGPADAAPLAVDNASVPPPAPAGDVVSLTGDGAAPAPVDSRSSSQPPEIFAEIWKDGMKIGVVYTDGQAVLPNSVGTTTGNTAMPAYMRAQQLSQEVGGEVRLVNIPALQVAQTRVQLQAAYGLRG